jgi:DNA polymerase III delta subunit
MPSQPDLPAVVALYGSERVTILEELNKLLDATGANEDGAFDYAELDGRSTTANEILDACATAPFLAPRRTVVVRRAQKLDKASSTAVAKALGAVPTTALLVLVFDPDEEVKDFAKDPLVTAAGKAGSALQGAVLFGDGGSHCHQPARIDRHASIS